MGRLRCRRGGKEQPRGAVGEHRRQQDDQRRCHARANGNPFAAPYVTQCADGSQHEHGQQPEERRPAQRRRLDKERAQRQAGQHPPAHAALHQRLRHPPDRQRGQQPGRKPRVGGAACPEMQRAEDDEQGGQQGGGGAGQPPGRGPDRAHGEEAQQTRGKPQAEHAVAGEPIGAARNILEEAARARHRLALDQAQPIDALAARATRRQIAQVPEAQQGGAEQQGDQPDQFAAPAEPHRFIGSGRAAHRYKGAGSIFGPVHLRRCIFHAPARPPRTGNRQRKTQPPGQLQHQGKGAAGERCLQHSSHQGNDDPRGQQHLAWPRQSGHPALGLARLPGRGEKRARQRGADPEQCGVAANIGGKEFRANDELYAD